MPSSVERLFSSYGNRSFSRPTKDDFRVVDLNQIEFSRKVETQNENCLRTEAGINDSKTRNKVSLDWN